MNLMKNTKDSVYILFLSGEPWSFLPSDILFFSPSLDNNMPSRSTQERVSEQSQTRLKSNRRERNRRTALSINIFSFKIVETSWLWIPLRDKKKFPLFPHSRGNYFASNGLSSPVKRIEWINKEATSGYKVYEHRMANQLRQSRLQINEIGPNSILIVLIDLDSKEWLWCPASGGRGEGTGLMNRTGALQANSREFKYNERKRRALATDIWREMNADINA